MTVFLNDTFLDPDGTLISDHTPDTGGIWTKRAFSDIDIQSNEAKGGSGFFPGVYGNDVVPGNAELDVTVDYRPQSGHNSELRARYLDENNYYAYRAQATNTVILRKRVTGTSTTLASGTETLTLNVVIAMKFEIRDAAKKCYLGGGEVLTSADNALTLAGIVAVQIKDSEMDNLVGDDAGAAPAGQSIKTPLKVWWAR